MNKKILASAVGAALVAGAGLAQADVKVYGIVQADVVHVTNSANYKTTQLEDVGQSRIGFDAVEDLGGGLKGLARIEFGTNPVDNQTSSTCSTTTSTGAACTDNQTTNVGTSKSYGFSNRLHWVGLGSKFGDLKIGTFDSAYKATGGVKWDPFVATAFEARNNGGMSSSQWGHTGYVNNAIEYTSPTLAGITFIGQTIKDTSDSTASNGTNGAVQGDGNANTDYSMALKAKVAMVELIAAKSRDSNGWSATAGNNKASTLTKVGAQAVFGPVTISYQHERDGHGTNNASQAGLTTNGARTTATDPGILNGKLNFLGAQFKVANEVIVAQFGESNYESQAEGVDSHYKALGVIHMFSKTTRAYLGYRETTNDGGKLDSTNGASIIPNTARIRVVGGGMRVDF